MSRTGAVPAPRPGILILGSAGLLLAGVGLVAFNLGYLGLYAAFLPLLGAGVLLFVEMGEDFFLSLLLLAISGALLYAVGLFALPLIIGSAAMATPVAWRSWLLRTI